VLNHKRSLALLVLMLVAASPIGGAYAQSTPQPEANAFKTEIYFGSDLGDSTAVSQEAWEGFVADVVVPRFPAGITVVEALGRGRSTVGPLTRTRVLIVVHRGDPDSQSRLSEIRAEYKQRYGTAGQFHIEHPVRLKD
jgi:hypothetical protein